MKGKWWPGLLSVPKGRASSALLVGLDASDRRAKHKDGTNGVNAASKRQVYSLLWLLLLATVCLLLKPIAEEKLQKAFQQARCWGVICCCQGVGYLQLGLRWVPK